MSLHKEISFEDAICEYLAAHGWLYADGDHAHYDRARALFPPDVLAWVQETQPKAWEILAKNHGAGAGDMLVVEFEASRYAIELQDRRTALVSATVTGRLDVCQLSAREAAA